MNSSRLLPPTLALTLLAGLLAAPAHALEECRLLRQPDIQNDQIVFVYAGDLWKVGRAGGVAARLTSGQGIEAFPKLSPDGRTVAFTAEYDGNLDAFTVPVDGGEPQRLTWNPSPDQVAEWYPDGQSILIRSRRASAPVRFDRFFKIPARGGFEEMLALPTGGYATFSGDGSEIAFVSPSYDNRTWKHYKGGNAPDLWVYDFRNNSSEKITDWPGPDEWPMWHDRTIYYASDRGGRTANLWAYDLDRKTHRQVTRFTEYDVKWPSLGGDAIVFENGGYLYVMSLPGEQVTQIHVLVPDDKPDARPEYRNVAEWTTAGDLSPSAKRAVIAARGELFTVPGEKGDVRNLTNTPGVRERDPAWSPDGRWIAFLSDAGGEYELHVIGSDGSSPDRQVTRGGTTFRYPRRWSPDSKKLAFSDKTHTLWWCDVATGKLTRVDKSEDDDIFDFAWSGDSRWIAYSRPEVNQLRKLMLYSVAGGQVTPVTDGMHDTFSPAFDPAGDYLYFISRRTFNPEIGAFELDFQFSATDKIYAATLRDTLRSPVAPLSDEETGAAAKSDDEGKDSGKGKAKGKPAAGQGAGAWRVDLAGIVERIDEVPAAASRYRALAVFKGQLLFLELGPPTPDEDEGDGGGNATLKRFDFEKRETKTVVSGIEGYAPSRDGDKVLYKSGKTLGIVETSKESKVGDGKIEAGTLMARVDPPREWMQMFNEAWRLERDFYYDPAMGGLDWKAIGERYRQLVPYVAHRADLNYILGELIGELGTSHTYVGGGDYPEVPKVDVGLLGADYDFDRASGRYRFKTIYRERDWNSRVAAPLGVPGVQVREGDVLLAVNGRPLRAPENLFAAFVGTTGKQTRITVGRSPTDPRPRTYTVVPVASEVSLRYTAWVNDNRAKVDQATGGRIAYIHLPNTATAGIQEFSKQYYPQVDKQGLIVDERFNGGGFIPDFFIERMKRDTWVYWSTRDGRDFRTPSTAIDGPKCMIVNHYAGSGGDALPYYFRMQGIGPVIGTRTWGGLVGISKNLPLVDGGRVTMPDFGMWDAASGRWVVENHGVDPDVEVENTPSDMVAGHDPQLERAIDYCLEQLKSHPPKKPVRPTYKIQQ